MAKNINYLGRVKLPFDSILSTINKKSTKVDALFDTERVSYFQHRSKKEQRFSKKIIKMYHSKKDISFFFVYYNDKLVNLIPNSFWKKFNINKDTSQIAILRHPPGSVSIPHIDRYGVMFKKSGMEYNQFSKKIKRLWISLTRPKMGHALFVGNDVAYNLKRGTVLTFNKDVVHSGCNIGYEDRFVLTVTGLHGQ